MLDFKFNPLSLNLFSILPVTRYRASLSLTFVSLALASSAEVRLACHALLPTLGRIVWRAKRTSQTEATFSP